MNKHTVIFDVDGILCTYDKWEGLDHYGEPIEENIKLCNAFYKSDNHEVCIWTTRTNPYVQGYPQEQLVKALEKKLKEWKVMYDRILLEPKPLYSMLIDDRSYNVDYDKAGLIHHDILDVYWKGYNDVFIPDSRLRNSNLP